MTDCGYFRRFTATALLAVSLAGCTSPGETSDEAMGRLLVAPDKFILFGCKELALRAKAIIDRQKELERLMAKAGDAPDGRLVSSAAYRPEYLHLSGEMSVLRNAAAEKNCKFTPGVDVPGSKASEGAVR